MEVEVANGLSTRSDKDNWLEQNRMGTQSREIALHKFNCLLIKKVGVINESNVISEANFSAESVGGGDFYQGGVLQRQGADFYFEGAGHVTMPQFNVQQSTEHKVRTLLSFDDGSRVVEFFQVDMPLTSGDNIVAVYFEGFGKKSLSGS
jgi:hypothetical protein